jgi:putative SOS response-associated peptidase YedK
MHLVGFRFAPRIRDLSDTKLYPPNSKIKYQEVLAIRYNLKTGQRSLDALRWGLIPYWAKDPKIAYRTINARVETFDTAPSYREAFKKRRCLIPADSFYEWKKVVGGKIPYAVGMKDDSPFVFAGLWEGGKTLQTTNGSAPVRLSRTNRTSWSPGFTRGCR